MRFCYDATRFGSGLEEAVELAADRGMTACEYSFDAFNDAPGGEVLEGSASGESSAAFAIDKLSDVEEEHLRSVAALCQERNVEISCLRLNQQVKVSDEKSVANFNATINNLALIAKALDCKRIVFYLYPESSESWLDSVERVLVPIVEKLSQAGIRLVLSTGTAAAYRGSSLRNWRPLEPQEWRNLIAHVPDLFLSFSVADCAWQGIDYLRILPNLVSAIDHVEAQDVEVMRNIISDSGYFGPLFWRYKTVGKGQVDWSQFVEALKLYDFNGSLSIQFNDEFASENEQGLWDALETSMKVLAPLVKY